MLTQYEEEYLGAIYKLTEEGPIAKTSHIANQLEVKSASVTEMMMKLADEGFIEYVPYHGATLTRKGLNAARKLKRKHRLLERFLYDILGLKKGKLHEEACRLEHGLSDDAEKALNRTLGYPEKCPDDEKPIPGGERKLGGDELNILSLKPKDKAKVIKLKGGRGFQSNLRTMGIRERKTIELIAREPAGGPVVIKVGNTTIALGRGMASRIVVER